MALILDKLNAGATYINGKGQPTPQFMTFWQKTVNAIQAAYEQLAEQLAAIIQNTDDIATNSGAITTLQTNVTALQADALGLDILTSYVDDPGAITAADVGTDATITIAGHNRRYRASTVAVTGGSVTGAAFATTLHLYYDDPTRAGGAVTYATASTAAGAARSAANPGRHYVGKITTPADGAGPTTGIAALPPGAI